MNVVKHPNARPIIVEPDVGIMPDAIHVSVVGLLSEIAKKQEAYLLDVFGSEAAIVAAAEYFVLVTEPLEIVDVGNNQYSARQAFRLQRKEDFA